MMTGQTCKYDQMKTLFVVLIVSITTMAHSCSKNGDKRLAEGALELKLHESASGYLNGDKVKLVFETVVSDSRCPANAICVWQGAATATFSFTKNNVIHRFNLSTITMEPNYKKDTTIAGYKLEFVHLLPYPGTFTPPAPDDQIKAELKITKL